MTRPTKGLADAPSADARAPIPLLRSRLHSGRRESIYARILDLDASWTGSSIAAPTRPCRTGCRPRRGSPPSPTPSANGPHPCRCGSEPTGLVRGPCRRGRPGPAVGSSRARRASARHPRRGRAGSGTSDSRVAAPRAATKPPSPDRAGTELTAQVLTVVHAMTAERHSGSAASGTSCCPRYQ